ncbi:hypothetical protein halTADL_1795 [Halohasta litchfieldiae]|jgi:hypothetical protein|uniref:Uncharacterized protein n=1 Tax=Halohasta litchfieldiae TaxID=1073996 RepID=A0A1H6QZ70_9EURY|nr:hypothetical protein [Halohasta litchfieldiae]ATW88549.1 hypothetical protein halTADL_1795 [Halohasta litchfieldiae]SEI48813.1 hypothetical protein SAMN05444271_101171 [Halohasta litchfieldiae]
MQAIERLCRLVAIQAALVVAAIHLIWAIPRFSLSLLLNPVADSRPFLFVPVALLLVAVAVALFRGHRYRRLSALGGGTLLALFSGYLLWISDPLLTALTGDPLALVSKTVELVGVAAFAVLYYLHHPDRYGSG